MTLVRDLITLAMTQLHPGPKRKRKGKERDEKSLVFYRSIKETLIKKVWSPFSLRKISDFMSFYSIVFNKHEYQSIIYPYM